MPRFPPRLRRKSLKTHPGAIPGDELLYPEAATLPRGPAWKHWLPRALFESALIVFSVLLALVLDSWNEKREQERRSQAALQAVVAEIRSNRARMEIALEHHRAMSATLRQVAASGERLSMDAAGQGLFRPATVIESAWSSARGTDTAQNWPYELQLEIGRIYERQNAYNEMARAMLADIYMDLRRRGIEEVLQNGYTGMLVLIQDFATREQEMLSQYDNLLVALDSPQVRNAAD